MLQEKFSRTLKVEWGGLSGLLVRFQAILFNLVLFGSTKTKSKILAYLFLQFSMIFLK